MKLNKLGFCAIGLSMAILAGIPALADGINARVKTVDPAAHTITVIEKQEDHVFTVTDTTQFVNAQDDVLATGFKVGDRDTLETGVKTGLLKAGTRLSITFQKQGDAFVASQVKLRDKNREQHDKK